MMKPSGVVQPLVLALAVAAGFGAAWGVLGLWSVDSARDSRSFHEGEGLAFKADGTPIVQVDADGHYRDLSGSAISLAAGERRLDGAFLSAGEREHLVSNDAEWGRRVRSFAEGPQSPVSWFFVCDGKPHGFAYLVAYDRQASARVGYLGTAGFRADGLPREEYFPFSTQERFPLAGGRAAIVERVHSRQVYTNLREHLWAFREAKPGDLAPGLIYVQTDNSRIYQIDLSQRTVRVALQDLPLRSSCLLPFGQPIGPGTPVLAVRTEAAVFLLDIRNEVVRRAPIPDELRERDFFWTELPGRASLAVTQRTDELRSGITQSEICWLDLAGGVSRREQIALQGADERYLRVGLGCLVPVPVVVNVVAGFVRPRELYHERRVDCYQEGLAQAIDEYWPSLLIAHLAAAGLAWSCYRRQVRQRVTGVQRLIWPLFVLLFGLPGWIGYRFGQSWPVLEPCPACAVVVPRDRAGCRACGIDFPLPALKGTELFA